MRTGLWLIICSVLAACGAPNAAPASDHQEGQPGEPIGSEVGAVVDGGLRLGPTHPGWKKPLCTACHTASNLETLHGGASHVSPTCVNCHGWNGAVHRDHAADPAGRCAECHSSGTIVSDHLSAFALPLDCRTCHVHPESPYGL
jgi:hypothetical protein